MDRFAGCRVLVVEDEYFIADAIRGALVDLGAEIVGPVATLGDALARLSCVEIDAAVLDIDLHGEPSYPLMDALLERRVPFLIATGYHPSMIASAYRHLPQQEKPYDEHALARRLAAMCRGRPLHQDGPARPENIRQVLEKHTLET
jgi:CheY-like chemotaxis protein